MYLWSLERSFILLNHVLHILSLLFGMKLMTYLYDTNNNTRFIRRNDRLYICIHLLDNNNSNDNNIRYILFSTSLNLFLLLFSNNNKMTFGTLLLWLLRWMIICLSYIFHILMNFISSKKKRRYLLSLRWVD